LRVGKRETLFAFLCFARGVTAVNLEGEEKTESSLLALKRGRLPLFINPLQWGGEERRLGKGRSRPVCTSSRREMDEIKLSIQEEKKGGGEE